MVEQDRGLIVQTEFSFTLPRGYIDEANQVHRQGVMRMAWALDEIEVVQDARVQANEAYLPVVLLSRVVTRLGGLPAITPQIIGKLFVIDLVYLEDLYERINTPELVTMGVACPKCNANFQIQVSPLDGE